ATSYGPFYEPTETTCDGLDNDCNGIRDDGFVDPVSGLYATDVACGSCAVDCTTLFALPHASGSCAVVASPMCVLTCDVGHLDLDGVLSNGCERMVDGSAIYVSQTTGVDAPGCGLGLGSGEVPCASIAFGQARAATTGRTRLRVANGRYVEAVQISNGVSLEGGHDPTTWVQSVSTSTTIVSGSVALGAHRATMWAVGITASTEVRGFVVVGPSTSGNSYAVYASNSPGLRIRDNLILAGVAGSGAPGSDGTSGLGGVDGIGRASDPAGHDAHLATGTGTCNPSNARQLLNGGTRFCGATVVSGGRGGGNTCPRSDFRASSATGALGSGPMAGAGGPPGEDGRIEGSLCHTPTTFPGHDGVAGGHGSAAGGGSGCMTPQGSVVAQHWRGGSGAAGTPGQAGSGGGGGGGGGGAYCASGCTNATIGAHGGGGGSGGCGGDPGLGGEGGAGSFGVFVAGGAGITISGNTIQVGAGGPGGRGGTSGSGGDGGRGGEGGNCPGSPGCFCSGAGGRGGDGGDGGEGGAGGGGCGGISVGILTSSAGATDYCASAMNVVVSGTASSGGPGGAARGTPSRGGDGLAGLAPACLVL
ncbi:MAG: hypothetical protein AB7P00_43610, partial [Sandaracinaceae bacterium]